MSASELETAERLLAHFVALAYAAEHPDLFTAGTIEAFGGPTFSSSAVSLVAQAASSIEVAQDE
jgi:hypothetical protein